ncbi:DUF1801 domain-containing protein [Algoriphagus sp. A40]|uniref:DUF1801 domain-containing protein n=1 Tax=Algoriphagus sp. A40 TaxID=1945863 RepID=UPI0009865661|nr:DUF1801 domain-containing protein [Algoriphagus sp. A40]OOG78131.1 hypothetical protein B0E43_03245 [Algoriphagus sp. A40]
MAETKTKPTEVSVDDFINAVESPKKREDAIALKQMMEEITGEQAKMWGPTIIGFGTYHYKYNSGHEGDAPIVGFSPRKAAISLYLLDCDDQKSESLLPQLGKFKKSVSCIYVNKLSDINEPVLREMIKNSFTHTKEKYSSPKS